MYCVTGDEGQGDNYPPDDEESLTQGRPLSSAYGDNKINPYMSPRFQTEHMATPVPH